MENTLASQLRTVSGSPRAGKSRGLCQNGGVASEAMGCRVPEHGSKGQGPLERRVEPPMRTATKEPFYLSLNVTTYFENFMSARQILEEEKFH